MWPWYGLPFCRYNSFKGWPRHPLPGQGLPSCFFFNSFSFLSDRSLIEGGLPYNVVHHDAIVCEPKLYSHQPYYESDIYHHYILVMSNNASTIVPDVSSQAIVDSEKTASPTPLATPSHQEADASGQFLSGKALGFSVLGILMAIFLISLGASYFESVLWSQTIYNTTS